MLRLAITFNVRIKLLPVLGLGQEYAKVAVAAPVGNYQLSCSLSQANMIYLIDAVRVAYGKV